MRRKIISVVLTLCMVMAFMPQMVFADTIDYNVTIGTGCENSEISSGTYNGEVTVQNGGEITGGTFNGPVTVKYGGAITDGTFNDPVTVKDGGAITDGTFKNAVGLAGEITGGTFESGVTVEGGAITGGTFNGKVTVDAGTITDGTYNGGVNVLAGGTISDGTFDCEVTVEGSSEITGGTFNGTVTVESSGEITGGIFYDDIFGGNVSNAHTVTFMDGNSVYAKEIVASGSNATEPTEPTRNGYTFTGWYTGDGQKYEFGKSVDNDITLYAGWEVTVPFTTKVKLGGNASPGKTTFNLQLLDSNGEKLSSTGVTIEGTSVTTNGAGIYNGTLEIKGAPEDIESMFSDGVFVKQVNEGLDNWTYDDTVWGLIYRSALLSEVEAAPSPIVICPVEYGETDGGSYYEMDYEKGDVEEMTFTNTYKYTESESSTVDPEGTAGGDSDNETKTGDDTNLALLIALMLLSGAGITGVTLCGRRKRTN